MLTVSTCIQYIGNDEMESNSRCDGGGKDL
jgi:hypothetical protein